MQHGAMYGTFCNDFRPFHILIVLNTCQAATSIFVNWQHYLFAQGIFNTVFVSYFIFIILNSINWFHNDDIYTLYGFVMHYPECVASA